MVKNKIKIKVNYQIIIFVLNIRLKAKNWFANRFQWKLKLLIRTHLLKLKDFDHISGHLVMPNCLSQIADRS